MTGIAMSRRVRYAAAAASALVTLLYLLTGLGTVAVTYDQPAGIVPPLLIAAGLFAVLTVALLRASKRWIWLAGAGLQVLVVVMYVVIAAERTPAFEAWGITVKVLQIGLLGALGWLALQRPTEPEASSGRNRRLSAA